MSEDVRKSFHEELSSVRQRMLDMAAIVSDLIPRATSAFLNSDLQAAQELIDGDDIVDELSISIDDLCYRLLALQNPMAGDLRGLVAAIAINGEIERAADLMVNVAKAARRLYGLDLDPAVRGILMEMSEEARRLFDTATDAYGRGDPSLASALGDMDDHLDQLNYDLVEAILRRYSEPRPDIRAAVQLALIGRYYERTGDHSVNIGERVVYMVEGWRPEHAGALRASARRAAVDRQPMPEETSDG